MPIGTVSPTPGGILIEKTKYDIIIKCNKDGYQEATYFNKSGSAAATFGNIVLGGGIGWAIDSASGSDNKYDSPVNITLPLEGGERIATKTTQTKGEKKEVSVLHVKSSDDQATEDSSADVEAEE